MKIKFPENLDLNRIFNPTSLVLTKESMIRVLSDIAERNPSMAIAILNRTVSVFVYSNNDTDENTNDEIFVTIENSKWQIMHSVTYKVEIIERQFIQADDHYYCIDTAEIK